MLQVGSGEKRTRSDRPKAPDPDLCFFPPFPVAPKSQKTCFSDDNYYFLYDHVKIVHCAL